MSPRKNPTITVYHPQKPVDINSGYTIFNGKEIEFDIKHEDGTLCIGGWETETRFGDAVFAKGSWAYVLYSEDK